MILTCGEWRSDGCAVGPAGAAVAEGEEGRRPPTWAKRQLIDGIRFRTRTGVPWRDVPERYGPWARSYDLFRRWQRDGTWHRIFTALQAQADAKDLITWEINVDSTVCRAHQHAAGARKKGGFKRNRLAALPSSRTTTDSDARAVA